MATTINVSKAVPGAMATFSVQTDLVAPYKYHWKKNGAYIPGAPSAKSYTTPPLTVDDIRAKYSCTVYGQDKSEESNAVSINDKIPDPVTVANTKLPNPPYMPFKEQASGPVAPPPPPVPKGGK